MKRSANEREIPRKEERVAGEYELKTMRKEGNSKGGAGWTHGGERTNKRRNA